MPLAFFASPQSSSAILALHLQASLNYPQSGGTSNEFNKIGCRWNDRTCTGFRSTAQHHIATRALNNLDVSAAQGNVGIGILDLDTVNVGFTMASNFRCKASQAPRRHCRIKTRDEGKPLNQVVTITRQEFAPGWSPILKEIKGDRGQFTVQYLLQRSVETVIIQRRMRWFGWSVDLKVILGTAEQLPA